jgi:hypothetical protein
LQRYGWLWLKRVWCLAMSDERFKELLGSAADNMSAEQLASLKASLEQLAGKVAGQVLYMQTEEYAREEAEYEAAEANNPNSLYFTGTRQTVQ